jgi:hypothetical protein
MMTVEDVRALVDEQLGPRGLAELSGSVLYSGIDTLRPGPFYIMGLNPGGAPTEGTSSIASSIHERRPWSAYTQDCWVPACTDPNPCGHVGKEGRVDPRHLSRHQKHVGTLISALGTRPEEVFATNAIFARSKDEASLKAQADGMNSWKWWRASWPIHQRFLREVRPRWIITLGKGYGTSPFSFLMDVANVKRNLVRTFGDDSKRDGRWFMAELPLDDDGATLTVRVLGMPHPSYYEISPELAETLRAEAAALVSGMVASDDPSWSPASAPPPEAPLETRPEYLLRFADGFHGLGVWEPAGEGWGWSMNIVGLDAEGRPSHVSNTLKNGPTHWRPVPDNWKALMDAAWGSGCHN